MKIAVAKLSSVSPYSQSKFYQVDKLDDGKESPDDYEKRTWRGRCHVDDEGYIFIPPMQFARCIANGAAFLSMRIPGKGQRTYTKHFVSGVMVEDGLTLPIKKDEVKGEWLFLSSDGKRGGGSRVMKCYPLIPEWSGNVRFMILDDTITEKVFRRTLDESGKFIGIGRFRPQNGGYYGRYKLDDLEWVN